MSGARSNWVTILLCCAASFPAWSQKQFTVAPNPISFGSLTRTTDHNLQSQTFTVGSLPSTGVGFTVTSSASWLTIADVNTGDCSTALPSFTGTTAKTLLACVDTIDPGGAHSPGNNDLGLHVALLTIRPTTDASYPPIRVQVLVQIFPVGDIKTLPGAQFTLTPDAQSQTVLIAFQNNNDYGSSSATIANIAQDPANLDEGNWLTIGANCVNIAVTDGNPCSLTLGLNPSNLNNNAQVGNTYQARVTIQSNTGDRADVGVTFNYSRVLIPSLSITSANNYSGTVGSLFQLSLSASGGTPPYQWFVTGLPAGLTLNSGNVISGTVSQPVNTTISVTVKDSNGMQFGPQSITLTFTNPANNNASQLFTHIADGGEWQSDILLANENPGAVNVEVKFHLDSPGALSITGMTPSNDIKNISLGPNASVLLRTTGLASSQTLSGWAEVISSVPLKGQVLFRRHALSDGKYYEASVPISSPVTSFQVPFDGTTFTDGTGTLTGLAIANTSAGQAQISCSVWDGGGTLIASNLQLQTAIPAFGHTAFILQYTDPFKSAVGALRGVLSCTTTQPVGVIGLRSFGLASISTLPVF